MKLSIQDSDKEQLLNQLGVANLRFQQIYPGDKPDRQPVHTVYGGANLFKSDTCVRMGDIALNNLRTYAPNFVELANVLQLKGYEHLPKSGKDIAELTAKLDALSPEDRKKEAAWLAYSVYNKIIAKLKAEPVEDFRIDFEDGFGNRPDAEEDATAVQAANEVEIGLTPNRADAASHYGVARELRALLQQPCHLPDVSAFLPPRRPRRTCKC